MLQQGGNQAVDCVRAIADNNPILRLGLTQRASVQHERAVADRRDRLSMAVSLIEESPISPVRPRSSHLVRPQRHRSLMESWELRD